MRQRLKNSSRKRTVSKNYYRSVMFSSNFLKVLEYIFLPNLEIHLPVYQNKFAYRAAAGYIDGITVSKETVMYYN